MYTVDAYMLDSVLHNINTISEQQELSIINNIHCINIQKSNNMKILSEKSNSQQKYTTCK